MRSWEPPQERAIHELALEPTARTAAGCFNRLLAASAIVMCPLSLKMSAASGPPPRQQASCKVAFTNQLRSTEFMGTFLSRTHWKNTFDVA